MNEIITRLQLYFSYPFVKYALIVGTLISLCASLLGVNLVLKRFSFIGDGLSHVAFGAMAVSTIFSLSNDLLLVMPVTVISAVLLLKRGERARLKGDAMIAVISVGALAVGYLVLNIFSTSANITGDVCSTLFGSTAILTLSKSDLWICIIFSILVIGVYFLCYNNIFAVTFDGDFAKAVGIKTDLYNLILAVITAVIIVLAMNLVGSLLICALIVFPALSAMRLFKSYNKVIISSAVIAVICSITGIIISILASTPVGSTIVAVYIVFYIMTGLISFISNNKQYISLFFISIIVLGLIGCENKQEKSATYSQSISFEVQKDNEKKETIETIEDNTEDKIEENTDNDIEGKIEENTDKGIGDKTEGNTDNGIVDKTEDGIDDNKQQDYIDVDLSILNGTMLYAEIYNIMALPDEYIGKTLKIRGQYYPYYWEETNKIYHYIVISDSLACCQQAMEFVCTDVTAIYPEKDTLIEMIGKLETYEEQGDMYYYLNVNKFSVNI